MQKFSVFIEGSGIEIPTEDGQVIKGFFVTRVVKALNERDAIDKALSKVGNEWAEGAHSSRGANPILAVEEVTPLGFWGGLTSRNSGYVFHPGE